MCEKRKTATKVLLGGLALGGALWMAACDDVTDPLEPFQDMPVETAYAKAGPTPNGPNALPERGRIVYTTWNAAAGHADLHSVEEDGSDLRRLTYSTRDDKWPAVSRDGRKIAYVAEGESNYAEIVVMNLDGSNPRTLTSLGLNETTFSRMEWSPNGKQLAIALNPSGDTKEWDLYLINTNNGAAAQITSFPGEELNPTWSPDGRWLAFSMKDGSGVEQVWIMRPDGSELHPYTSCAGSCAVPAWSPDGSVMAYQTISGTLVTQLADPTVGVLFQGIDAAWAPDGTRLAVYDVDPAQYGALSTVSANGGPTQVVRSDPGFYFIASWARR